MRVLGINIALVALCALCGLGCDSDPIHDLDVEVDCNDLCNRYRDCFDSAYDTASCRGRCDETANRDRQAANECDTCLDPRACSESFVCADECYGLIP